MLLFVLVGVVGVLLGVARRCLVGAVECCCWVFADMIVRILVIMSTGLHLLSVGRVS